MIVVFHIQYKVVAAHDYKNDIAIAVDTTVSIQHTLYTLSLGYEDRFIGWCANELREELNVSELLNPRKNVKQMRSYSYTGSYGIDDSIGYVDQHVFVNVPSNVSYPTWLMSSDVGFMHTKLLGHLKELVVRKLNFDVFLCTIAKQLMPKGLVCRSEPKLLKNVESKEIHTLKKDANARTMVTFIRNNYKRRWIMVYFLNMLKREKKFIVLQVVLSLFRKPFKVNAEIASYEKNEDTTKEKDRVITFDVIIPTLGRKKYLYDVLKCFGKQSVIPNKVVIVEQPTSNEAISELDYLEEHWPFKIDHVFTKQRGACNARNMALDRVEAEWTFLADDDILFKEDLLSKVFQEIQNTEMEAFTVTCVSDFDEPVQENRHQTATFGSGCSFVKSEHLKNIRFRKEHEFGFGEDIDFGNQLRAKGVDIFHVNHIRIQHLKADTGGFRYVHTFPWTNERIQPKPSPTVMAYYLKHATAKQLLGYKTILFLNFYKHQSVKNPFKYLSVMRKRWESSIHYAKMMME